MDAGADYLSVTAKAAGNAFRLGAFADEVLRQKQDAGEKVSPASRFGFRGLRSDHMFTGVSDHGALVVVSGAECGPLAQQLITRCDNVSRLDLQVTVWTHGEQPHLGLDLYRYTRANYHQHSTRRSCGVTTQHPAGEMFTLGKRISDVYCRVYDKAAESNLGPSRTVWRYEVEFKRKAALTVANRLALQECPPSWVTHQVHQVFSDRAVECTFEPIGPRQAGDLLFHHQKPDHLAWFRNMVQYSISKAINVHGLPATLESLGLSRLLPANAQDHLRGPHE